MAKKTITQALRDLFLGLGGQSAALADNETISDYVADLESAIKNGTVENAVTASKDPKGKDITSYVAGASLNGTDLSLYDGNIEPVGEPIDLSGIGGGGEYLKASYNAQNSTWTFPDGYDRSSFIQAAMKQPTLVFIQLYEMSLMLFTRTTMAMSSFTDDWILYQGLAFKGGSTSEAPIEVIFRVSINGLQPDTLFYREFPTT